MSIQPLQDAIRKAERVFAAKPDAAFKQNPPATARLLDGLRFEIVGPGGERVVSDMPAALGGADSAPVPGWYLRGAMAACTATAIRMHAARLGIDLDALEVTVESSSDARGLLDIDGVSPSLVDVRMSVRIAAAGADPVRLRELVERGQACSPVSCTISTAAPCALDVDVGENAHSPTPAPEGVAR